MRDFTPAIHAYTFFMHMLKNEAKFDPTDF